MKMSKEQLIEVLEDMIDVIKADDSFEGSIQYTVMDDDLGPGEFEVGAFYRVGNSIGQGGAVVIQGKPEPGLEDWELDLQTNMEITRQEMQRVMEEEDAAEAHRVA
jgi:hypothetical protein